MNSQEDIQLKAKDIQLKAKELIKSIRDYVKSQTELWQQIPALAAKASNSQLGFYSGYAIAYNDHIWFIKSSARDGVCQIAIQLETGELIKPFMFYEFNKIVPANDDAIIYLGFYPDEIDAQKVINDLKQWIEKHIKN